VLALAGLLTGIGWEPPFRFEIKSIMANIKYAVASYI